MRNDSLYIDLMRPFYNFVKKQVRVVNDRISYYGTGEAGHWAIQSNFNITGALGILATHPQDIKLDKEEVLVLALKLFRYNLNTHKLGESCCTCKQQWGGSWISVLGLERMTAGLLALEKFLTAQEQEKFRDLCLYEADWLLENYPVCADISGDSGKNKPESNYWNASFLYRTAMDQPDAPHREAYLEKSCELFLNSISHPADAASEQIFRNKKLCDWHVGANFTSEYSLDHHSYLNVGYMVITLSHAAYLYLYCRRKNYRFPAEALHHVEDLWKVLKNFIFPDGRLLRIGGDSRARYCYCQMYLLPVLLLAKELFRDPDAEKFESGMLNLLTEEQKCNSDGSFFGSRLREMQYKSRYYYTRLESDPFAVLGFGDYWHRTMPEVETASADLVKTSDIQWVTDYHGAVLHRSKQIVRAVCDRAAGGATLLAVPSDSSDLAEWGGNGLAKIPFTGYRTVAVNEGTHFQKLLEGAFIHSAIQSWQEIIPRGEGEPHCKIAQSRYACAALPDGKSLIVLEKVTALKEHPKLNMRSISWKIPNDLHNNSIRNFYGENFHTVLHTLENRGVVDSASRWLNVDNKSTLILGYGADSLQIYAPATSSAGLLLALGENDMPTLYLNEICGNMINDPFKSFMPGDIMADTGYAVIADCRADESNKYILEKLDAPDDIRAVAFTDLQQRRWIFAANFSDNDTVWQNNTLPAGECIIIY